MTRAWFGCLTLPRRRPRYGQQPEGDQQDQQESQQTGLGGQAAVGQGEGSQEEPQQKDQQEPWTET